MSLNDASMNDASLNDASLNGASLNGAAFSMSAPLLGPAPEVAVSNDMVKRGLLVAPLLIAICGFIWGLDGAWSSA